jgi:hypothetical protein
MSDIDAVLLVFKVHQTPVASFETQVASPKWYPATGCMAMPGGRWLTDSSVGLIFRRGSSHGRV